MIMHRAVIAAAASMMMPLGWAQAQTAPSVPSIDMTRMGGDAADRFMELQTNFKRLDDKIEGPSRTTRSVPAKPKDIVEGRAVHDAAGVVVGTITKVSSGFAVVSASAGEVEVDAKSFAKNRLGLLINLPSATIKTLMVRRPPVASKVDPVREAKVEKIILPAKPQLSDELLVRGDGVVRVAINGKPMALRIDPAAPSIPLVRKHLATGLASKGKRKGANDFSYIVGQTPVRIRGQLVDVDLGFGSTRTRVGWTDSPFSNIADGSIGPGAFSEEVVRFELRDPIPGEKMVAFPMERDALRSGAANQLSATFGVIEVEGKPMRVCFDPHHPRTLVTAGAGQRLARQNRGEISGEAVPTEIFFGVRRPVRTLTLQQPLQIGTLAIDSLGIRTSDQGHVAGVSEASAPSTADSSADVVVTAKAPKYDPRTDTLSLGSDYLSRCSSIVFDRKRRVVELACAAPARQPQPSALMSLQ